MSSDTIVVGTDGSATAQQAVTEAVRIAKALDADLHVVTAYRALRGVRIRGAAAGATTERAPLPDDVARSVVEQAEAEARVAGVRGEAHMVDREPGDALLEVADRVRATMIVVGSQGMSGPRRLLGSVPNKVSHEAHCNVLIVATRKPDRSG